MKIVIPGGSGQVGTLLARTFHADGHDVVVLSRRPRATRAAPCRVVEWDASTPGAWAREIDGADVIVNLTGQSVNCRYNAGNREAIMQSRVGSTRIVGEAIAASAHPPPVWLQASTATIYAHRSDAPNDEIDGIIGGHEPGVPETWRFSIDVATAWERELDDAEVAGTQKVKLRSAMIMSPDRGGIFDTLLRLARRGLGGQAGDGRQYVSWVHEHDFVRAIYWLIEHDEIDGVVNVVAAVMFGVASGAGEAIRLGWSMRLASIKVCAGVLATVWVLTFSGLGLLFWPMAYANYELLREATERQ